MAGGKLPRWIVSKRRTRAMCRVDHEKSTGTPVRSIISIREAGINCEIVVGYASPTYRDKLNARQPPAFIGFDEESDFIAEAKWLARQFGDQRFSFRTNS